jgi:hypothetical protein
MKFIFAAVLAAAMPALVLAQAPTAAKPAAKVAAKPGLARSAQKAVEEATPLDEDAGVELSEAQLAVARLVFVGEMKCELGATVKIVPLKREGLFLVTTKGHRFRMHPVESRTGAIRLEDAKRGAVWLQLGNKSMLMSQKLGQRLADECQSPEQATHAEYLKANPPPNLLEDRGPTQGQIGSTSAQESTVATPTPTPAPAQPTQPAPAPARSDAL